MKLDLEDLECKARAVGDTRTEFELAHWTATQATDSRRWRGPQLEAAGHHIAANSPPVTLALVARIRELESACRCAATALQDALQVVAYCRGD